MLGLACSLALGVALVLVALALFGLLYARWRYPAPERLGTVLYAETGDGYRLALHRLIPQTPRQDLPPVILCHGMSSNAYWWEIGGFAQALTAAGREVFLLDLRGHGASLPT